MNAGLSTRPSGPTWRMSVGLALASVNPNCVREVERRMRQAKLSGDATVYPRVDISCIPGRRRLYALFHFDDGRDIQAPLDLWLPAVAVT